jgi:hypothetical protein
VTGVRASLSRRHRTVLAACALAAYALAAGALAFLVFTSGAAAATVDSGKFFGAVVPDIPTGGHLPRGPIARAANLPYGGGPVMHSNRTHVIFWAPSGSGLQYDPGYEALVERFMRDVAADSHEPTNVYGLSGQYYDRTGVAAYNSAFAGAVVTTDWLPPNGCTLPPTGPGWTVCLSDAQLEAEIGQVISVNRLPTGLRDIYILVMPNGMGTCEAFGPDNCALSAPAAGSFCGYHSTTPDGTILYAVIPYNAVSGHCQSGNPRPNSLTADPAVSTISHEHNETVTDPLGTGWIDGAGNEDGDLCRQQYGPILGGSGAAAWNQSIHGGHYFLQEEWSNVNASCQPRTAAASVSFAAPGRVRAGVALTLTGRARDPHPNGKHVAFAWFFGDGGRSSRRTARHTFRHAGRYTIVLRFADSWGNWAFATHTVKVTQRPSADTGRRRVHRE